MMRRWTSDVPSYNSRDARITRVAFDRIVPKVARAAVELDHCVGGAVRGFRREEPRHRGRLGEGLALVLQVSGLEDQEPRRFEIDFAVGDHPLDTLEICDRLSELPALLHIGLGGVHGGA